MSFNTNQPAYTQLRSIISERSDAIVAWVGAGLSAAAGLPSWHGLRDALADNLRLKAESGIENADALFEQHDIALGQNNLWDAFSHLQEALGTETYRACIRNSMNCAFSATIPSTYLALWELRIAGMLNLNIDRLATRAYNKLNPGKMVHEFPGARIADSIHILKSGKPWIANLHGVFEEFSTWVFTTKNIKVLTRNGAYRAFVDACITTRTLLFVGITADDLAAGGHLERLSKIDVDHGPHFWITSRSDATTDQWAEENGILVIRYDDHDNHIELNECFADLRNFKPADEIAPPVTPSMPNAKRTPLPTAEALVSHPNTDEIRQILNAHAASILREGGEDAIGRYQEFTSQYGEAIYRAWYVTDKPPRNALLGYELLEKVNEGAFGTIFLANDPDGNTCAIKLLHERIREDFERLHSFRRGVRSMNILTDNNVTGVVPYYSAFEIPAFVAMEYVEGIDLSRAVRDGIIENWADILRIATALAHIIRRSHRLPQRVLHRDIRPTNIMLRNCWGRKPNWDEVEVVVLDFDLSWHIDAQDVSITEPGTANGYLAPEQVSRDGGVSTRSAAVDSFGLGMTIYFLATCNDPTFSQHLHGSWKDDLKKAAKANPSRN